MNKRPVDLPMSLRERIGGLIYIPMHCLVLPLILELIDIYFDKISIDTAKLNLIIYAIGFVFCLLFMWKFLKKSFDNIFEKRVRFIRSILIGLGITYALGTVVSTIILTVFGFSDALNPNSAEINALVADNFNSMSVTAVIFAPIIEECMFRGALFGSIRKKSRFWAYFATIVVFAFYHLFAYFITDYSWELWIHLLQYVPVTFAMCYIYEKTETIWCPIALHALNNFLALSLTKFM